MAGHLFNELYDMALALRTMIKTDETSSAMKTQAAVYLAIIFETYFRNKQARKKMDEMAGLIVPPEVYKAMVKGHNLEDFLDAEQTAFQIFSFAGTQDIFGAEATLNGHSITAMSWLARIYSSIAMQYYHKTVEEVLILETQRHRPELAEALFRLDRAKDLNEMLNIYFASFPTAQHFLGSEVRGLLIESGVRIELSPGGIGDSAFLASVRPSIYGQFNWTGRVSQNSGRVDDNVKLTLEVRPRSQMRNGALMTVDSTDMAFQYDVKEADDITRKSDATLILDSLMAIGILPERILEQAKAENREEEVVERILDRVLGEGNGLAIYSYVDDIQVNSGLGISSQITTNLALAFGALLGRMEPQETVTRSVDTLTFSDEDVPTRTSGEGFYEVQISSSQDFSEQDTYTFTTDVVDGTLELDIIVDDKNIPRENTYYTRTHFVAAEDYREGRVREDNWSNTVTFSIDGDGIAKSTSDDLNIVMRKEEWGHVSEMDNIAEAIVNAQWVAWLMGAFAGMQDDTGGIGGLNYWRAGQPIEGTVNGKHVSFPGRIVPMRLNVPIHPRMMERLTKGVIPMRIGLSEKAERALHQVFWNQASNAATLQSNAWKQISLECVKFAVMGDTVSIGRVANAGVPEREGLSPISINPDVTFPMRSMVLDYGRDGHSHSISGARSTGTNLLYVRPDMPKEDILAISSEAQRRVDASLTGRGQWKAREEQVSTYKSEVSSTGPRLLSLTQEDIERRRKRFIRPEQLRKQLDMQRTRKDMALRPPEQVAMVEEEDLVVGEGEDDPILVEKGDLNVGEGLSEELARMLEKRGRADRPEEVRLTAAEIEAVAEGNVRKNYDRFNVHAVNPFERAVVRDALMKNNPLIAKLSPEEQRAIFLAIEDGLINPLLPFNERDLRNVAGILVTGGDASVIAEIQARYEEGRSFIEERLRESVSEYKKVEKHDTPLVPEEFYSDLEDEKAELKAKIDKGDATDDEEFLYDMLQLAPEPEFLTIDHFLFQTSKAYNKHFGDLIADLDEAAREGGIVLGVMAGGWGARFGEIKHLAYFHFNKEANANYLRLRIRNWASFLHRHPGYKAGFLHIVTSAFTEDAIDSVLGALLEDEGFYDDLTALSRQRLRNVVHPTKRERELDLLMQAAATVHEYEEKRALYNRMDDVAEAHVDELNKDLTEPIFVRAFFEETGLDPLSKTAPTGTGAGAIEAFNRGCEKYSLRNLVEQGLELDEDRVVILFPSIRPLLSSGVELNDAIGRLSPEEQNRELSLAKASLLVKNKKALSVAVLMNSSTKAEVGGGELALAHGIHKIWSDMGNLIAVGQCTTTAAGGDPGGIYMIDKNTGAAVSQEGNMLEYAQGVIFEDDPVIFLQT